MNDHGRLAFIPRLAGTAVITAFLSTMATPAFASTPTPSPFSAAALAHTVKSTPAPVATAATTAKTPAKARQASGSFFKSKVGVLVIAVFAAGTGYAIYSAKEDRILGLTR